MSAEPQPGPNQQEKSLSLEEALGLGVNLHRSGRLPEAEILYRRVLEACPDQPDACHFLGLLAHQRGQREEAVALICKAIALAPGHADAHNNLGNVFKEQGNLAEAQACFRRVIDLGPGHASAYNNLGVAFKEQGKLDEAVAAYQEAIRLRPGYVEAHYNLGNACFQQENLHGALAAYQAVVALQPDHAEGHHNLGRLHERQGKPREAMVAFRETIRLKPDHGAAHYGLGNALMGIGAVEEGFGAYRAAFACSPQFAAAYKRLATSLTVLGRTHEAAAVWRKWAENDPENPVPRHMLAAATGQSVPDRATDEFVKSTFDQFAEDFDEQLKRLDYRAPELIAAAVLAEFGGPAGDLHVLDMGCGTGWCGRLLRPYARHLAGLDLSPAMLAKAQARAVYDELITGELTRFLEATFSAFDLIISADTLVYFGDLTGVFRATAQALRLGGRLVFSLERAVKEGTGFSLHAFGRYSHGEAYVRSCLTEAGFGLRAITRAILRTEAAEPVAGWVITAVKAKAGSGAERAVGILGIRGILVSPA